MRVSEPRRSRPEAWEVAAGFQPAVNAGPPVPFRRVKTCLQGPAPQPAGGMLGAGGTCEFTALSDRRSPASTSVTGFCACLRSGCFPFRKHLPRWMLRGAAHAPGAGVCRQAQPRPIRRRRIGARRSAGDIRVSRGPEGRGERPATGHGQPRAARTPQRWAPQVENLRPLFGTTQCQPGIRERPATGRGQPRATSGGHHLRCSSRSTSVGLRSTIRGSVSSRAQA
jgi:hypothetical protein